MKEAIAILERELEIMTSNRDVKEEELRELSREVDSLDEELDTLEAQIREVKLLDYSQSTVCF